MCFFPNKRLDQQIYSNLCTWKVLPEPCKSYSTWKGAARGAYEFIAEVIAVLQS